MWKRNLKLVNDFLTVLSREEKSKVERFESLSHGYRLKLSRVKEMYDVSKIQNQVNVFLENLNQPDFQSLIAGKKLEVALTEFDEAEFGDGFPTIVFYLSDTNIKEIESNNNIAYTESLLHRNRDDDLPDIIDELLEHKNFFYHLAQLFTSHHTTAKVSKVKPAKIKEKYRSKKQQKREKQSSVRRYPKTEEKKLNVTKLADIKQRRKQFVKTSQALHHKTEGKSKELHHSDSSFNNTRVTSLTNGKCPKCKGDYHNAKTIKCGHSFCKECLDGLLEFHKDGSVTIKCPLFCKKKTVIKWNETTSMLRYKENKKHRPTTFISDKELLCQNKQSCGVVSMWCIDCCVGFCKNCCHDDQNGCHVIPVKHSKLKKLKPLCTEHDTLANFLCFKCDQYVCLYCRNRSHKGHSYGKIFEQLKEIERSVELKKKKIDYIQNLLPVVIQNSAVAVEELITWKQLLLIELKNRKLECLNSFLHHLSEMERNIDFKTKLLVMRNNLCNILEKSVETSFIGDLQCSVDRAEMSKDNDEVKSKVFCYWKNTDVIINCTTLFNFLKTFPDLMKKLDQVLTSKKVFKPIDKRKTKKKSREAYIKPTAKKKTLTKIVKKKRKPTILNVDTKSSFSNNRNNNKKTKMVSIEKWNKFDDAQPWEDTIEREDIFDVKEPWEDTIEREDIFDDKEPWEDTIEREDIFDDKELWEDTIEREDIFDDKEPWEDTIEREDIFDDKEPWEDTIEREDIFDDKEPWEDTIEREDIFDDKEPWEGYD